MTKRQICLSIILSLIGLAVWIVISEMSNEVEAWDSVHYFLIGLPIMFAASAIAGFIEPEFFWRWGFFVVVLQPIALFVQGQAGPSFAIIGLLSFLFFIVPAAGCAYLGKLIRKLIGR